MKYKRFSYEKLVVCTNFELSFLSKNFHLIFLSHCRHKPLESDGGIANTNSSNVVDPCTITPKNENSEQNLHNSTMPSTLPYQPNKDTGDKNIEIDLAKLILGNDVVSQSLTVSDHSTNRSNFKLSSNDVANPIQSASSSIDTSKKAQLLMCHRSNIPPHIRILPKTQSLDLVDDRTDDVSINPSSKSSDVTPSVPGMMPKYQSLDQTRPIYPNVPYSPYGSPYGSPRSGRRRPPLRESRRVSIEQTGSFLQLNQYKLMDQIGQVCIHWSIL